MIGVHIFGGVLISLCIRMCVCMYVCVYVCMYVCITLTGGSSEHEKVCYTNFCLFAAPVLVDTK